jgi:hypothetical protein
MQKVKGTEKFLSLAFLQATLHLKLYFIGIKKSFQFFSDEQAQVQVFNQSLSVFCF